MLFTALARSRPLVAVFGRQLPADVGPGVRSVALKPADPQGAEWTVVALGPHSAIALIAREHDDNQDRSDDDQWFDFVIAYQLSLVTAAASGLLARMP